MKKKTPKAITWRTEKRRIGDLVPYAKNPRRMTEKQTEDLKRSLEKFGLVEIPAINTDGTILAGHMRLKLLKLAGRGGEEIDVRVPDRALTADEFREYNVRSNLNGGEFDFELLKGLGRERLLDLGFEESDLEFSFEIDPKKIRQKDIDEGKIIITHKCPKCGYTW